MVYYLSFVFFNSIDVEFNFKNVLYGKLFFKGLKVLLYVSLMNWKFNLFVCLNNLVNNLKFLLMSFSVE